VVKTLNKNKNKNERKTLYNGRRYALKVRSIGMRFDNGSGIRSKASFSTHLGPQSHQRTTSQQQLGGLGKLYIPLLRAWQQAFIV
jgi:hypothetical protein